MSDSETSSDINVSVYDNKGKINDSVRTEQKKTTESELYFGLLANQNKIIPDAIIESSETEYVKSDSSRSTSSIRKNNSSESATSKSSSKSKSSKNSKNKYETINLENNKYSSFVPPPFVPQQNVPQQNVPQQHVPQRSSQPVPQSVPQVVSQPVPQQLTPLEMYRKKVEILKKLAGLKMKGFTLSRDYSLNDSYEEMEYEYELVKSYVDRRNGVKVYKNIFLHGVSLIEFFNKKYDPFDFHLQGWGEHMAVEVDNYDDVMEELYEKYKRVGQKMGPEIRLLILMCLSAGAFHMAKSQSTIPGLDTILSSNPDLLSRLFNPEKQKAQFMSPQESNIDKLKSIDKQKELLLKQQKSMQQNGNNMSKLLNPEMPMPSRNIFMGNQEMKTPVNVQDILNKIKQDRKNLATDTQDETSSNNDRILSDVNLSENKRGRKVKTPSISVNTK